MLSSKNLTYSVAAYNREASPHISRADWVSSVRVYVTNSCCIKRCHPCQLPYMANRVAPLLGAGKVSAPKW